MIMRLSKFLNLKKKELFRSNNIAALIDKSEVESAETIKKTTITQDQKKNVENAGLSLGEEDALKAQCLVVGVFLWVCLTMKIY